MCVCVCVCLKQSITSNPVKSLFWSVVNAAEASCVPARALVFASLPNSYIDILIAKVMLFEGRAVEGN